MHPDGRLLYVLCEGDASVVLAEVSASADPTPLGRVSIASPPPQLAGGAAAKQAASKSGSGSKTKSKTTKRKITAAGRGGGGGDATGTADDAAASDEDAPAERPSVVVTRDGSFVYAAVRRRSYAAPQLENACLQRGL